MVGSRGGRPRVELGHARTLTRRRDRDQGPPLVCSRKFDHIAVDGIVGDITWLNIDEADTSNPTIRKGSTGNPVRRAQKRLTLGGYDTGGVDGIFGASTETAVKKFQKDLGLTQDGIVGPETWDKIDSLGD